jgi:uncharacterized lipoprotein YddW (UPF0748 family)
MRHYAITTILVLLAFLNNAIAQHNPPKRELRGVWIATVANIDWPSKPGLSVVELKKEFIDILDMHKSMNMNAVFVQIRPCADAFFPSQLEPWSKWLTGTLGKSPPENFDPLAFMVKETHKRSMQFHAWFNPYRAYSNYEAGIDSSSLVHKKPSWFVRYGKNMYFNPGLPDVKKHVTAVIMDVVHRYNIDGVHFDDYFYPYKISGAVFDDSVAYSSFNPDSLSLDNWRRGNVNAFIKKINDSIHQVKPHVQFGVSPFGVWRNATVDSTGSQTKAGQTCYDDLYADVLTWMKEGWVDYIAPQLYWSIGYGPAAYDILAEWWNKNSFSIPLYLGMGAYKVGDAAQKDKKWMEKTQIPLQLLINRQAENIKGNIFFSSKSFNTNPLQLNDMLKNGAYKYKALPPAIGTENNPTVVNLLTFLPTARGLMVQWTDTTYTNSVRGVVRYVVYRKKGRKKIDQHDAKNIHAILGTINASQVKQYEDSTAKRWLRYTYAIAIVNDDGNESNITHAFTVKRKWRTCVVYP